ncbi:dihydrolipoamide acetyltransferase family protein [Chloroflexota bacterium]
MATEVFIPKVDMVMDTATFVEWLINEGEQVEKGKPLFVILTDKAAMEIEAPASGILAGINAQPDDVLPVSETIAFILEPGEKLPERIQSSSPAQKPGIEKTATPSEPLTDMPAQGDITPIDSGDGYQKIRATPVARRLAMNLGIDLTRVPGRGPKGRIHKADVMLAAENQTVEIASPAFIGIGSQVPNLDQPVPLPVAKQKEVVPLAGPRRIIAQRMAYSASVAPHINLSITADMTEAQRLRTSVLPIIESQTGYRLSFTTLIAYIVTSILPRHPFLNSTLNGEEIILWEDIHLGIATNLNDYLIVPVIREAQSKNLQEIVASFGDLLDRANAMQLTPAEMSGSTFTISNLGMFGIESFTAIINPPEAAILAVGKINDVYMKINDAMVQRPMMNITICADHRIVDGVAAAKFLAELKSTIENPYLLIKFFM